MIFCKNKIINLSINFILIISIIHIIFSFISINYYITYWAMFPEKNDFFADSLKTGLAQKIINNNLLISEYARNWPEIFQNYLYKNDYNMAEMSTQYFPPVGKIIIFLVSISFLVLSPIDIVFIIIAIYAAAAYRVSQRISALMDFDSRKVLLLILISFPSLMVLHRGNLHSGLTSLALIFYMISVYFDRWRWARYLAIAFAVNIRPNVAIFVFMELARGGPALPAFKGMICAGLLSLLMFATSFAVANGIDPSYTLPAFLNGYEIYTKSYAEGIHGVSWNASLYNIVKIMRSAMSIDPIFSASWSLKIQILGLCTFIISTLLAYFNYIKKSYYAFALATICSLFTPVYMLYHLLVFVGPLFLIIHENHMNYTLKSWANGAAWLLVIQLLCFVIWVQPRYEYLPDYLAIWIAPTIAMFLPLVLIAMLFPVLVRLVLPNGNSLPHVLTLACIGLLSPLGSDQTNGIATVFISGSCLIYMLIDAFRNWHLSNNRAVSFSDI